MTIVASALKTELLTDPKAVGYSTFVAMGDYNRLADLLNRRGQTNETISISIITSVDLQANIVGTEYISLNQAQRDLWNCLITTGTGGLAISNTNIRSQIGQVWSAATSSRALLTALQTRSASRIEVLFGEGLVADTNTIQYAVVHG